MRPRLKISHIGMILVSVPVVFEVLFVVVLTILLHQVEAEVQRADRSKTIIEKSNVAIVQVMRKLGCLQQFNKSSANTDQRMHWKVQSDEADKEAKAALDELRALLRKSPEQLELLRDTERWFDLSCSLIFRLSGFDNEDITIQNRELSYSVNKQLNNCFYKMLANLDTLLRSEKKVEAESPALQARNRQVVEAVLFCFFLLNIVIAFVLAAYFSRFITRRLGIINDNTSRLAQGKGLNEPLKGEDEIAHVDHVFHDMADKLQEVDRMKKEFVEMISHDLRTPLTSIHALLAVLQAGILAPDAAQQRIKGAEADVTRLVALVNDLLDLERMEAGKLDMDVQEVALCDVLERSVQSVLSLASSRAVQIDYPTTHEIVLVDGDRLVQVLVNLLSNAIKFSKTDSSVEITLSSKSDTVRVSIIDQGRGIPEQSMKVIFDRFKQVEITDSKEKGGSGLGLAICKTIIEQLGGTIGVESEVGIGSIFWVEVPRVAH